MKESERYFPKAGDAVFSTELGKGLIVQESQSDDIHHITKYCVLWLETLEQSWTNLSEFVILETDRG